MIREWAKDVYGLSKRHLRDQVRRYRDSAQRSDLVEDGPRYLLPEGYRSRRRVVLTDHEKLSASGTVWQPDVYELALQLAQIARARFVMGVGCGRGERPRGPRYRPQQLAGRRLGRVPEPARGRARRLHAAP